jgi:hypothetical protein
MVANWIFTASKGCQLVIHSQQWLPTGNRGIFHNQRCLSPGFFPNYLTTCFLTISEDAFLLVASHFFCQSPKVNYNQYWLPTGFITSNDGCTPVSFPPACFNPTHTVSLNPLRGCQLVSSQPQMVDHFFTHFNHPPFMAGSQRSACISWIVKCLLLYPQESIHSLK